MDPITLRELARTRPYAMTRYQLPLDAQCREEIEDWVDTRDAVTIDSLLLDFRLSITGSDTARRTRVTEYLAKEILDEIPELEGVVRQPALYTELAYLGLSDTPRSLFYQTEPRFLRYVRDDSLPIRIPTSNEPLTIGPYVEEGAAAPAGSVLNRALMPGDYRRPDTPQPRMMGTGGPRWPVPPPRYGTTLSLGPAFMGGPTRQPPPRWGTSLSTESVATDTQAPVANEQEPRVSTPVSQRLPAPRFSGLQPTTGVATQTSPYPSPGARGTNPFIGGLEEGEAFDFLDRRDFGVRFQEPIPTSTMHQEEGAEARFGLRASRLTDDFTIRPTEYRRANTPRVSPDRFADTRRTREASGAVPKGSRPRSRESSGERNTPRAQQRELPSNWWDSRRASEVGRPLAPLQRDKNPRKTIREWKITFEGGNEFSAEDFLCQISEMREGTSLTDADLLHSLPDLLQGMAKVWARAEAYAWNTWADFVYDFRARYSDRDFQFRVSEELKERTQGPHEPIIDYIAAFRHIARYLSPQPPLDHLLTQLYHNLRPEFRRSFYRADFVSYRELELLGREFEANKKSAAKYVPPPSAANSVFKEVAYKPERYTQTKPAKQMAAVAETNETQPNSVAAATATTPAQGRRRGGRGRGKGKGNQAPQGSQPAAGVNNTQQKKPPQAQNGSKPAAPAAVAAAPNQVPANAQPARKPRACFNCGSEQHLQMQCTKDRRADYCTRCGNNGVVFKTCPKCNPKPGN